MTTKVQTTLALLADRRELGVTWRELSQAQAWGHSNCSRVLSELHRHGIVARLRERRDGCSVYVRVGYEQGRDTRPHRRDEVTLEEQALAGCIEDGLAVAERVRRVVASYGLLDSRFAPLRLLGSELLAALDEPADEPVLPL